METRFAHLNPDKCKMSSSGDAGNGEGAGSETTVTEETGSQSEMDLLKMKIRLRELELEIAREQRGSGQSSRVEGGHENPGVFADIKETVPVLRALTEKLVERTDCLLSEEAWRMLKEGPAVHVTAESESDGGSNADVESGGVNGSDREDESAAELFRREQQSDATLQRAWENAKAGKGGLSVVGGLLYHKDKLLCNESPEDSSEEYKRAIIDSRELKVSLDRKTLEVETLKRQVAELTAQVETLKTRPLASSPLPQQQPPPPLATNFKPTPLLLPQRAPAQTQPATQETGTQGSTRSLPYDLPGQGTPQGSILSPLLFNVGLRRLALELEEQQDLGYDITLWATRGSYGDRKGTLQRAIDVVETFTRQAGMKCAPAKSTYVHIRPKNTQAKRAPAIQLYLDGEPIKRGANMRVLGMHVQETGSVSIALSKLKRTVRSITGLIRRIARSKEGMTEADTLRLVHAFVISRITYALPFQATRRTETDQLHFYLLKLWISPASMSVFMGPQPLPLLESS
ncbi:hypothetical protein HPB50_018358 [Hyalomma asiaticum]|uniref:Uncharacterized protein n=1 Tax=Hyalomma asiaticum TaxID=266040 RepID=A0ACB7TJR9_HYAAI|nr:hypothetical protein HPB50_018358 [Hyalomma asiaticum]